MDDKLRKILQDVAEYCEDMEIYDKLSKYNDFYYKIMMLLKKDS